MTDEISGKESIVQGQSGLDGNGNEGQNPGSAHQPSSSEDMRIESLARKALNETIQDGGAFAGGNSNQFRK